MMLMMEKEEEQEDKGGGCWGKGSNTRAFEFNASVMLTSFSSLSIANNVNADD